jgi:hypothetical protein
MTKLRKLSKKNLQIQISEVVRFLKALVICPNEKTVEFGSLLAVARAEARKREKSELNPPIWALRYFPELCVYVAVYEAIEGPDKHLKQGR